ncbi:unnamed protein product, partial [Strongylus vulgaris]
PPTSTFITCIYHGIGESIKDIERVSHRRCPITVSVRQYGPRIKMAEMKPLAELYENLMKKHTEIKNQQLKQFISKAVPYGIDPPNPKIAEYETFKSDKSANFVRDGNGNVVFRQFRRLRLADVSVTFFIDFFFDTNWFSFRNTLPQP